MGHSVSYPFLSCLPRLSTGDKSDCTTALSYICPSDNPPICLSFHPSLAVLTVPSAPSLCLSVCLFVCPAVCPALVVLTAPRSHAVAVFCSVMATGATPALPQPMDRQPFFLTLSFSSNFLFPSKVYFAHSLTRCCFQSLSVICLHLHPPLHG